MSHTATRQDIGQHMAELPDSPRPALRKPAWLEILVYAGVAAAVGLAWLIVNLTGLRAGSEAGYWLGVAGGILMLLLFAYPLRKRIRFMSRWGAAKWWFIVHMVLGIGGPMLILVHSTFQVGSLNAGVALYSMLVVAGSGVVGRFLYLRIHRGLNGERQSLAQLQQALGLQEGSLHSALAFAPEIEQTLLAYEAFALAGGGGGLQHLRAFTVLPLRRLMTRRRCAQMLRSAMRAHAQVNGWDEARRRNEHHKMRVRMDDFLQALQRVAQFNGATQLFSLWHVLHVPFVYLMVLCALAHVVAVHIY